MEQQTDELRHSPAGAATPSARASVGPALNPASATSAQAQSSAWSSCPSPHLRFPRPQGSQQLANWVSHSWPSIMQPPPPSNMSDVGSLTDSAYELVTNTDSESQDEPLASSVSSLVQRPSEVQSVDGSSIHNHSDSDDNLDQQSRASSMRYADQSLQNPSIHQYQQNPFADFASSADSASIEFKEGGPLGHVYMDKISVKHTIREFTEEETAVIAKAMHLASPPNRLTATICQTMSHAYLNTQHPFRLLYVGSPAAYAEIVKKVSSAILASGTAHGGADATASSAAGLYNIVAISEFGSTEAPEVEYMKSSGYQIRVEHCTSAAEIVYEGASFPKDTVYSITIDHERTYQSLFSPSGSLVQPKWTLPHIAIFYCTENDDAQTQQTRDCAWEFMSRHGVPSIFVTNTQTFSSSPPGRWRDFVNQHGIHLCLESRDPARPILPLCRPIDLASFLNIDARQMNRNLTYLTGLSAPPLGAGVKTDSPTDKSAVQRPKICVPYASLCERPLVAKWTMAAMVAAFLGLLMWPIVSRSCLGWGDEQAMQVPRDYVSRRGASSLASSCTANMMTATKLVPTTATVTINITQTVHVSRTTSAASGPASSVPVAGYLSDKPSGGLRKPMVRTGLCSVQVYGPTEFLVKLPAGSKASWLARGAIDIDVYRGDEPVRTKLSSIDEGILVELKKRDAHGVLNVSVVTSRRPRVNETFAINFGKPPLLRALHGVVNSVTAAVDEAVRLVDDAGLSAVSASVTRLGDKILETGRLAQDHCKETVNQIKESFSPQAVDNAKQLLSQQMKVVETALDDGRVYLLEAQIASKLWWLKVQGKTDEYGEYQRNATQFMTKRLASLVEARGAGERSHQAKDSCGRFNLQRLCRHKQDGSSTGDQPRQDTRWMRIMG